MQSSLTDITGISERLGEVRGELRGLQKAFNDLRDQIESYQRVNVAAHQRHDDEIDSLRQKLDTKLGEDQGKHHVLDWVKNLSTGGIAGAAVAWFFDYMSKGGGH